MKFHIREKIMSLHGIYNIFDDAEKRCYYAEQKILSLTNKTFLYDADEREVAQISRKPMSLHAVHWDTTSRWQTGMEI